MSKGYKLYRFEDEEGKLVLIVKNNADGNRRIKEFFGKEIDMINFDLMKYKHIKKGNEKYYLQVIFVDEEV